MSWRVAQAWVDALYWDTRHDFLGIWRAQRGPGPWSIFLIRPDGIMLEVWATPDGKLYGKKLASAGEK